MDALPTVSVVIPAYNHAEYILACLDSVFQQTFDDFEIIVINDGSTDATDLRLHPFVANGKIRYSTQHNSGQAVARNRGLAQARGRYVAFLDDDDLWPPGKLAWQVEMLDQNPWTGVAGTVALMDAGDTDVASEQFEPRTITASTVLGQNPFRSPGQFLVRTESLRNLGGFDSSLWGCDDMDLWIRLAAAGALVLVDRPALVYRRHLAGASNNTRRMLENGSKVIAKNSRLIPRNARKEAIRNAHHWLYRNYGRPLLLAAAKKPRTYADLLLFLRIFMVPLSLDRQLALQFYLDAVVPFMRKTLSRPLLQK